jgi:hypothetical protein
VQLSVGVAIVVVYVTAGATIKWWSRFRRNNLNDAVTTLPDGEDVDYIELQAGGEEGAARLVTNNIDSDGAVELQELEHRHRGGHRASASDTRALQFRHNGLHRNTGRGEGGFASGSSDLVSSESECSLPISGSDELGPVIPPASDKADATVLSGAARLVTTAVNFGLTAYVEDCQCHYVNICTDSSLTLPVMQAD